MKPTVPTVLATVLILCCSSTPCKGQDAEQKNHRIAITIDGNPCFALPVVAEVTYRNDGDEPWTFTIPTRSRGASVKYRIAGTEGLASGYTLGCGETTVSRDGVVSMTSPMPELRTLEPGQSYVLKIPLEPEWMGYLTPANWTVWIRDLEQKFESNRIEMPLRFTRDSVKACLEIASDTDKPRFERAWHARWLQKVMPGLELSWRTKDTSPEGIARRNTKVDKELDAFRAFLKDPKNEQVIQEAIDRINREAGLPTESAGSDRALDAEAGAMDRR